MNHMKSWAVIAAAVAALVVPTSAAAQSRGRAVPRGTARVGRPPVVRVVPYRPYYRAYRPGIGLGFYHGYPRYYSAYPYAYAYRPYAYAPYAYGPLAYSGYAVRPYGGIRIDLPERDAEVYADGYFLGTVDEFDGAFQQANLETGPHRIEIRAPGFETIAFDVNIEPGRTITYRASMRPLRP